MTKRYIYSSICNAGGNDHKDIYYKGNYHCQIYKGNELIWEKKPAYIWGLVFPKRKAKFRYRKEADSNNNWPIVESGWVECDEIGAYAIAKGKAPRTADICVTMRPNSLLGYSTRIVSSGDNGTQWSLVDDTHGYFWDNERRWTFLPDFYTQEDLFDIYVYFAYKGKIVYRSPRVYHTSNDTEERDCYYDGYHKEHTYSHVLDIRSVVNKNNYVDDADIDKLHGDVEYSRFSFEGYLISLKRHDCSVPYMVYSANGECIDLFNYNQASKFSMPFAWPNDAQCVVYVDQSFDGTEKAYARGFDSPMCREVETIVTEGEDQHYSGLTSSGQFYYTHKYFVAMMAGAVSYCPLADRHLNTKELYEEEETDASE